MDCEAVEGSVQLAPGNPNDFAVGAQIDGKKGVLVPGPGDFAMWFRGDGGALSASYRRRTWVYCS